MGRYWPLALPIKEKFWKIYQKLDLGKILHSYPMLPPPIPRKILQDLAKMSHSHLIPPPPTSRKILKDFVKRKYCPLSTWTPPLPPHSQPPPLTKPKVSESMPLQYFVCEIYENNSPSFDNVTYINSTIICSCEKSCLPVFNIKTINCGPNFYYWFINRYCLKSSLIITDYYSV